MSRSYKKYPCWSAPDSKNGVHSGVHDSKKLANRKARRPWYWDTPSGSAYRRITDPWDIRDYKSVYYTHQSVADAIEKNDRELNGGTYAHEHPYKAWELTSFNHYKKYSFRYYYYAK
jgi:hypothetical protein